MRSILIILVLTAFISGQELDLQKDLRLSNTTMERLEKSLGEIDLEERILKLRNLGEQQKTEKLTEEQEKELNERIAKIKKVVIEKPPGVRSSNLFEVNEQSGIANFLYQGDINLTEKQLDELTEPADASSTTAGVRAKRGTAMKAATKWPKGIVYYYLDTIVTSKPVKVSAINAAMKFLQTKTCISFQFNRTAKNRILITDADDCFSMVGMVGDEQVLSIGDDCHVIGTVAHELAHALGFEHMQRRSDRNAYITVNNKDLVPGVAASQFEPLDDKDSINYTPFDYGGFMQYPADYFAASEGLLTMVPTDTEYTYTMGNGMISFYDVKMINMHYGCTAKCPASKSAKCQNGGEPNPNNCAICNCPLGYGGALCDQRPTASGGCGAELTASDVWKSVAFQLGENTKVERSVFTECHHWIKAQVGSKIQVRIINMQNPSCDYGCPYNGIEFKLKDKLTTSPKICCKEFLNVTYTSVLNPMPVIAHNRYGITKFTIEYRSEAPAATTAGSKKKTN